MIHIDACSGLENVVDVVFPRVKDRECMRNIFNNFMKKFKGILLKITCDERRTHTPKKTCIFLAEHA